MTNDKVYCHYCSKAVAKFDPERVQRGLEVFHAPCLRKAEKTHEDAVLNARLSNASLVRRFHTVH